PTSPVGASTVRNRRRPAPAFDASDAIVSRSPAPLPMAKGKGSGGGPEGPPDFPVLTAPRRGRPSPRSGPATGGAAIIVYCLRRKALSLQGDWRVAWGRPRRRAPGRGRPSGGPLAAPKPGSMSDRAILSGAVSS